VKSIDYNKYHTERGLFKGQPSGCIIFIIEVKIRKQIKGLVPIDDESKIYFFF